jgi:thiamine pyrophosphate-dependent acetolactate synthase large subunit-like protein
MVPASMPTTALPRNGAEILLDCLIRRGVDLVFAYPGGATLPIHQALTKVKDRLRTILPRHEQGGGFAASGYARSSGKVGVCFATSGPGATNLVTCLADARREGVALLAITGQVGHRVLGTDAFQEIPIVSACRSITKHHYLILRVEDIPRVVKEAMHIALTGRPGPVIIDVPKDLQARRLAVDDDPPLDLPGFRPEHVWSRPQPHVEPGAAHPVLKRLWQIVRDRGLLDDTILTASIGRSQAWVARSYRFPSQAHWITSGSIGAIGFALPAAMGAQAAHPSKTVIAVDTPASFLSNVHELGSAYCEKLPVKVLLLHYGPDLATEEEATADFVEVARGFRAGARRLLTMDEVDDGLHELLASRGPYVLDVQVPCPAEDVVVSASRPTARRTITA